MGTQASHLTELSDLAARVDDVLFHNPSPERTEESAAILTEYRRRLNAQVREDTLANLEALRALSSSERGLPVVEGLAKCIEDDFALLEKTNLYGSGNKEIEWCIGLWQFYLDAIAMVEEIHRVEQGAKPSAFKRIHVGDCDGLAMPQAILNMMEVAIPGFASHNLWRGLLPTLFYYGYHGLNRWAPCGFIPFCRANRTWTRGGQLAAFHGIQHPVPVVENREILDDLMDRTKRRTKHNIILGAAHRSGYLDLPVVMEGLTGLELGSWCNNAFYGKAMAQKFCDDPLTVPIRGYGAPSLANALEHTAELMVDRQVPVLIFPEGSTTSVLYGQQLRVKRGTRLAAEAAFRKARGSGRDTFIVPITIGDPIAFLLGQRDSLVVRFHEPIRIDTEMDWTPGSINDGDPAAIELEMLYLQQTEHLRRGWHPLPVIEAVRQYRRRRFSSGGLTSWIQSRFNMPLIELARTSDRLFNTSTLQSASENQP